MNLNNTQLILIVVIVIAVAFVVLRCNGNQEGFHDQVREVISNPYFADRYASCPPGMRLNHCASSGYDKSIPLDARGQEPVSSVKDILADGGCSQCTRGVPRWS